MTERRRTVVVTGASQGIGAAIANLLLEREYNVVANSRRISDSHAIRRSDHLAPLDGDVGLASTGERIYLQPAACPSE